MLVFCLSNIKKQFFVLCRYIYFVSEVFLSGFMNRVTTAMIGYAMSCTPITQKIMND